MGVDKPIKGTFPFVRSRVLSDEFESSPGCKVKRDKIFLSEALKDVNKEYQ
jgi:hypothetical protein